MVRSLAIKNKLLAVRRINFNKEILTRNITVYRIVVLVGFLAAMALSLVVPVHMTDPDDWAYYYAAQNFAEGQYTVDDQTHSQQVSDAQSQGGQLIQYVEISDNTWALEKAPGYVLYLIPFELLGIPRYGNVLLALGMVIVTFILLKRLRDEKAAMIGSLLMLFTPVAMVMLNRTYMDTYASLAFLVMGGGLYLYYHLERKNLSRWKGGTLLALALFLIGWSVVSRYTNATVAVVLALHLMVTRVIEWRRGDRTGLRYEILPVVLGIGLSVLALGLYDYLVFGSPLRYGYNYTRFDISFAYQYLGQVNQSGQSIPLQIILNNLRSAPRAFLAGYPLLAAGIPALGVVLYHKFAGFFRKGKALGAWSSLRTELSWDVLLVLIGWFIGVFFLYLMYEWTADFQGGGAFITFDRFYLPGLFPVAVIGALVLARLPYKLYIPATLLVLAFGSAVYAQWAYNLNILPNWLYNGTFRGGFRGGPGDIPGNGQPPGGSSNGGPPNFQPGRLPENGGSYFPQPTPGGESVPWGQ